MVPEAFRHLVSNGKDRIEAVHDVLEDHGDFFSPDLVQLLFGESQEVLPLKENFSA